MIRKATTLIISLLFLFSLSSCNWDVWGGEFQDYGEGSASVGASTLFTGAKPEEISATKSRFSDEVRISWNRVKGADYYEIFKTSYEPGENPEDKDTWIRLTDTAIGSTSYVDTNVVSGQAYAYKVRARSFEYRDVIGSYSDVARGWVLTPPLSVEASQGESSSGITISWTKANSVVGYKVYWSATGYDGTWETISTSAFPNTAESAFFSPDEIYQGKTLYFHVTSITNGGLESESSVVRQGYTFVEGAPESPGNISSNKGESTSEITISWDAMYPREGSYDWEIYRRAGNESEVKIYSTAEGDPQPVETAGRMSYTDSGSLTPGVSYTYTVMAIGTITNEDGTEQVVNGMPASVEGFLLSPPTVIREARINDSNDGFVFTFLSPLGDDGSKTLTYSVYGKSAKNGQFPSTPIITKQLDGSAEYSFEIRYEEGGNEYFDIRVNYNNLESAGYASLFGDLAVSRPVKARGYSASDNTYASGMNATGGIFPVMLQMDRDENAIGYEIKIWIESTTNSSSDADFTISATPEIDAATGTSRIVLPSEYTPAVGERYYYALRGRDSLGRTGEWSDVDSGYGAITGDEIIKHMQVFCLKPWESIGTELLGPELSEKWEKSEITGLISQAGMGSLGNAEENGNSSGRMTYSATYSPPASGSVSFTYTNFGEKPYMYINGSYNMNVSMSGSGSCTGGITIGGMYPATIGFTNISVASQKFVGTYTVTQQNGHAPEEVNPTQEVR